MKNLLVLAVLMSANVMAGERVLLKDSKTMKAEINDTTVFCSAVGYSNAELKINIAGLDGWTFLDHTNITNGDFGNKPCMTAGRCKGDWTSSIDSIIQGNPRAETITVERELVETRSIVTMTPFSNDSVKSCQKTLTEKLKTVIAGKTFAHKRTIKAEVLPVEACTF